MPRAGGLTGTAASSCKRTEIQVANQAHNRWLEVGRGTDTKSQRFVRWQQCLGIHKGAWVQRSDTDFPIFNEVITDRRLPPAFIHVVSTMVGASLATAKLVSAEGCR